MTNVDFGLLDEDRHFAALEMLSLRRLGEGDLMQAFRLADRRCRIPPIAEAHHYTLRGEISYLLGDLDAAIADITKALELAPDDLLANRRMLAWGTGQAQTDAARRLLSVDHDYGRIAAAIETLREAGQRAFAKVEWTDDLITGWAAWDRPQQATVIIESDGEASPTLLTPDPQHDLAGSARYASSFTLKRPRSRGVQRMSLLAGKTLVYQMRLQANERETAVFAPPVQAASTPPHHSPARAEPVSIIVPVYGDFEATKACFDSLMRELKANHNARLIIVNDASEDRRINDLVSDLQAHPRVRLLVNEENLGFAESVNKGLAEAKHGDIILLNADTVVPPGFVARLQTAAHSEPGIGTLTPLSNNGEFTSFPVPYRLNPLRSYGEICDIDEVAARVNAHRIVDMPNGIGFCLYVTRACLDVIGNLAIAYRRGYFEDVDLCLRAREAGFRNVCATSVYIGHAGSRSFGAEKRALVVHNLATIEQRFPKYRPECAAFVEADPLHAAREAIERKLGSRNHGATLLLCGPGPIRSVAEARARRLDAGGERTLLAVTRRTASGPVMSVASPAKDFPQSIRFDLSSPEGCTEALDYFGLAQPARIEIADITRLPSTILDWILRQRVPVDLLIADGGLLCPRGGFVHADGSLCDAPHKRRLCDECLFGLGNSRDHGSLKDWPSTQEALLQKAKHIYAPTSHAKSFATRFFGRRKITEIDSATQRAQVPSDAPAVSISGQAIGFVAVGSGMREHKLIKETARVLNRELPERSVVVVGQTVDDLELIKLDNVYVTGAAEASDHDRILRQYAIDALFVPVTQPLFGHPKLDDLSGRRPTAFFDWSFGDVRAASEDLALSPYLSDADIAASLVSWLSGLSPHE